MKKYIFRILEKLNLILYKCAIMFKFTRFFRSRMYAPIYWNYAFCSSFFTLYVYWNLHIRTRRRNVAMKVLHELVFHVNMLQGFCLNDWFCGVVHWIHDSEWILNKEKFWNSSDDDVSYYLAQNSFISSNCRNTN